MKKNKKGFTLVELLAVIVILALLIVITANTILPMMNKTKKNAMVVYASSVMEKAAANYVIDSMMNGGESIVYSIETMMGGNTKYYGAVKVSTTDDGKYSYDINMFEDDDKLGLIATNLSSSEIKESADDIISSDNYLEKTNNNNRKRAWFNDETNLASFVFEGNNKGNLIKIWEVEDSNCFVNINNGNAFTDAANAKNWRCTDFIKIEPNAKYKFNAAHHSTNTNAGVAFYTNAKEHIKISTPITCAQLYINDEFTAPSNAYYIRASWVTWGWETGKSWQNNISIKKIS